MCNILSAFRQYFVSLKEGCAAPADYDQGTRAALRVKRDRLIHLSELGNVGLLGVGNSEVRPRAQQAARATTSNEIVWVSSSKLYTYQHIVFFIHRSQSGPSHRLGSTVGPPASL